MPSSVSGAKLGLRQRLRQSLSSKHTTTQASPAPNATVAAQHQPGLTTSVVVQPQPNTSSSNPSQSLLAQALQRLSPQDRDVLQQSTNSTPKDVDDTVEQAIVAATDKRNTCLDKRWTCTIAGRKVVLREEAEKVIRWLDRFKSVGDIASSADPVHVGLPWAAIRLVLETVAAESNQMAALLVGSETTLYMAARLKAYTDFMHSLPPGLTRRNLEESIVLMYASILQFLARAIQVYHTSTVRRFLTAIWKIDDVVDFEKKVNELADKVERDASNGDRSVSAQDQQALSQLQSNLQHVLAELQQTRQLQASIDRLHLKIDLDKIPYAKGAILNSIDGVHTLCHPATRHDLLAQVKHWSQQSDAKSIFWLHGAAGAGKSTISWTFANWLNDQGATQNVCLGASFFFKRGEGDRGSAARFFPTLVRQLVLKIPGLDLLVAKAIDKDTFIFDKALGEQFRRLLLEPLREISTHSLNHPIIVVVVDALDECESESDIETILLLWSQLLQITKIRIRLFLTSRPDPPVRLSFRQMSTDMFDNIVLQDAVPLNTIEQDLRVYLRDTFANIREQTRARIDFESALNNDWPGDNTINTLVNMAVPLFIVAATICRFVGDLEFDPSERLDEILACQSTGEMAQMEMAYLPVLRHLTSPKRSIAENAKLCRDFQSIIGSIICLVEPLSVADLAVLLNKSVASIMRRLHPLHSVLRISDDHLVPVRTLHLSFTEFLLSQNPSNEPFRVDASSTHAALADHCLQLLSGLHGLRSNICSLDSPGMSRRDVDPIKITNNISPALQYACRYWILHVQYSNIKIMDNGQVHTFLQKHYLHWLEALSFMDRISDAIKLLAVLKTCVSTTACLTLSPFLEDARRFVLAHRYVADSAPLQLYSSCTIFAPQNSLVRHFCGEIPEWIPQQPRTLSSWGSELQKLEGHSGPIRSVAFSPDNSLLASASHDFTVRLWNSFTGEEMQVLEGHNGEVLSVAFSHGDSFSLASASADRTIRLWNPLSGREVQKIKVNVVPHCVAFSPRTLLLASGLEDGTVRLWNSDGQEVQRFEGNISGVTSVSFSYDDSLLASAAEDGTVRLWDLSTAQEIQKVEGQFKFGGAAISYNGAFLASASVSDGRTVSLWDPRTALQLFELNGGDDGALSRMTFSSDSSLLALTAGDRVVQVWDTSSGEMIRRLRGSVGAVYALAISPDGLQLATSWTDLVVRLWSLVDDEDVQESGRHVNPVGELTFSHDGSIVASACLSSTAIQLWDSPTGQMIRTIELHSGWISRMAFSHDDSLLAVAQPEKTIHILDLATGQTVQRLEGHEDAVFDVAFSHDDAILASASRDKTARLWNMSTGQELHKLEHTESVCTVSFSSDNSPLFAISKGMTPDTTLQFWNVSTGQMVKAIKDLGWINLYVSPALSDNGSLLAVIHESDRRYICEVHLQDLSTGKVVHSLDGLPPMSKLSFMSDDTALLTNRGVISIDTGCSLETKSESLAYPGLFVEYEWVTYKGKRILWLPHEYRDHVSVYENTIAFGTSFGTSFGLNNRLAGGMSAGLDDSQVSTATYIQQ